MSLIWWIALVVMLLAFPFLLGVLSDTLRAAPEAALKLSKKARANAWVHATNEGTLSPPHVATVSGGSILMAAAFVGQLVLGFYLLAPVLGPILALPSADLDPDFLKALGRAAIGMILIVPAVSGAFLADIAGYGKLTPASYIRERKMPLFLFALVPFVGGLMAVGAAGLYRGAIILAPYLGAETAESYAAFLGAYVVFSADALVVFGISLSAIGLEPLIRMLVAVVLAAAALMLALASPMLRVLKNVVDAANRTVSTTLGSGKTASSGFLKRFSEFVNGEVAPPAPGSNGKDRELSMQAAAPPTYSNQPDRSQAGTGVSP